MLHFCTQWLPIFRAYSAVKNVSKFVIVNQLVRYEINFWTKEEIVNYGIKLNNKSNSANSM